VTGKPLQKQRQKDLARDYLAAGWSFSVAALFVVGFLDVSTVWRVLAAGFFVITTIGMALRWINRRRRGARPIER
jgi:hypothetical protein